MRASEAECRASTTARPPASPVAAVRLLANEAFRACVVVLSDAVTGGSAVQPTESCRALRADLASLTTCTRHPREHPRANQLVSLPPGTPGHGRGWACSPPASSTEDATLTPTVLGSARNAAERCRRPHRRRVDQTSATQGGSAAAWGRSALQARTREAPGPTAPGLHGCRSSLSGRAGRPDGSGRTVQHPATRWPSGQHRA